LGIELGHVPGVEPQSIAREGNPGSILIEDDRPPASGPRGSGGEQPDRAPAEHDHRFVGLHLHQSNRVIGGREDVATEQRVFVVDGRIES
jgi:hypothetical protein